MVDQIVGNNPGRVAAVEWHISSTYPLYQYEGRAKWRAYPGPYNGGYATPWAWIDGVERSYVYSQWPNYVASAMAVPSDVGIQLGGWYSSRMREGEVEVILTNTSPDEITDMVHIVITEDSLYYLGPNGDPWHNHVCRDYVPGPGGNTVTIPGNGSDTLVMPFTLGADWVEAKCNIVVYFQEGALRPDNSKPVYQGAIIPVGIITGIEEERPALRQVAGVEAKVLPNPLTDRAQLRFNCPAGERYEVTVYGTDGRQVRALVGAGTGGETGVTWDRTDENGRRVSAGVYAFRVNAGGVTGSGKVVVSGE